MDNLMDLIFGIVYNDHDSDLIGRDQVDDELNDIEKSMAIIQQFIEQEGK